MKRTIYLFTMVFSTLFMSCDIEPLSSLPQRSPYIEYQAHPGNIPASGCWVECECYCQFAPFEGVYAKSASSWISSLCISDSDNSYSYKNGYNALQYGNLSFTIRFCVEANETNKYRSGYIDIYSNNDELIDRVPISQLGEE